MLVQGTAVPPSMRSVLDTVFAARAYRWAEEPGAFHYVREWWSRLGEWLSALRADNPAIFRLLVALLLLSLLVLIGHAAWVVWQTVRAGGGRSAEAGSPARREIRDAAWYYCAADGAASAGRISEALQLAFVGLALTLDAQGLLRYHPGKTPAECAREANLAATDRERLKALVRSLYACAFSGQNCGAVEYHRWRESGASSWNAPAH